MKAKVIKESERNKKKEIDFVKTKRKSHIGCWKNKESFENVYNWLFGNSATNDTKRQAYGKMVIWKMRRLNFTPAAILSTIVLLEVQIKDCNSENNLKDLSIQYASAFTRFLNYMTSVTYSHSNSYSKSMYVAAKELKIPPFIVDLRHLCAHGDNMPSIATLRCAANYCLTWLKNCYWDHEMVNMRNVNHKNLRQNDVSEFQKRVKTLFQIYDVAFEMQFNDCDSLSSQKSDFLEKEKFNLLKNYSKSKNKSSVKIIAKIIIKELFALVKSKPGLKDMSHMFVEAISKMEFFFNGAAINPKTNSEEEKLIKVTHDLFNALAVWGFIEDLFSTLVAICENDNETFQRKSGASFWAHKITQGFEILQSLKNCYKFEKEKHFENKPMEISRNFKVSKPDMDIFSNILNIRTSNVIMFDDTIQRPFSLIFTKDFIRERLIRANIHTELFLKSCMALTLPPFNSSDMEILNNIVKIYNSIDSVNVEDIKTNNLVEMKDLSFLQQNNCTDNYGIWKKISEPNDWHKYPLGQLL